MTRLALVLALATPLLLGAGPPARPQVHGDPALLLVGVPELPSGFRSSGAGPSADGGAAALFMRPAALGAADDSAARLMGVKARLRLHAGVVEARAFMHGESRLNPEAIRADLGLAGAAGQAQVLLRDLAPLSAEDVEADEVVAYRVAYRVDPLELVEYRFRLRVANAVADLFVTARAGADGSEPAAARASCIELARVQAGRLIDSLR
jgi:hypothetical protein